MKNENGSKTYNWIGHGIRVTALQFNGTNAQAVMAFRCLTFEDYHLAYDENNNVIAIVYSVPVVPLCRFNKTDWFVKTNDGKFKRYNDHDFNNIYTLVDSICFPFSLLELKVQLRAVNDLIKHWKHNLVQLEEIKVQGDSCTCCAFSPQGDLCHSCPIFQKTKLDACKGTPWGQAYDCLKIAKTAFEKEIAFLHNIRSELQVKVNEHESKKKRSE